MDVEELNVFGDEVMIFWVYFDCEDCFLRGKLGCFDWDIVVVGVNVLDDRFVVDVYFGESKWMNFCGC